MRYSMVLFTVCLAAIGCRGPWRNNLPPAQQLMEPGPGVGGPGPGVMSFAPPMGPSMPQATQLAFVGPEGMMVNWDVAQAGMFDSSPLVCPGRYNFPQGAVYRLKLSSIPGRPGRELFPSVEVAPATPRTAAFLSHNPVPIQFSEEDLDQVTSGNFVTKVIYLPDDEFQDVAIPSVDTLVSTRLDPGINPVVEADRRGSILAIVRVGGIDLMAAGSALGGGMMEGGMMGEGGECGDGCADGCGPPGGGMPPAFVAGVTSPEYGMTMSGTPIGLPGPPHIPLGGPAGLQRHTMRNYTHYRIPGPTKHLSMHVKHKPGFSYPRPPSHMVVKERTFGVPLKFKQTARDKRQVVH